MAEVVQEGNAEKKVVVAQFDCHHKELSSRGIVILSEAKDLLFDCHHKELSS
ncbi:MAG: hypothetical protein ABSA54_12195 [Terriglobales bacterium]|jgi:hypothetical protein